VFEASIFTLGVLTDGNKVDVVVLGLDTLDRNGRADVGVETESLTEGQIEGAVTWRDASENQRGGSENKRKRRIIRAKKIKQKTKPVPMGVAKGPLRPTLLRRMDSRASGEMRSLELKNGQLEQKG